MMKLKFVSLLVLIFLSGQTILPAQTITWDGKRESLLVGKSVYILEDKEGKLNIDQASASPDFKPSVENVINYDGTNSVYWLKFTLQNNTPDSLLLEVAQARLAEADFYYKDDAMGWHVYRAGNKIPISKKVIKHHYQLFPLARNCKEFYFRFRDNGCPVPVSIWEAGTYEQKMSNQKVIYGIYMGMMIFVILINLFFFFSLKRAAYLHYALLVFLYATFSGINDGYILYVYPGCEINYWFVLNPVLNQPNGLLYSILFLQVYKYDPKMYKFSLVVLVYFTSFIFWHQYIPVMTEMKLGQLNALFGVLLMATLGIRVGLRGYKLGYYFAVTYFIFLIFCTVEVVYIRTGSPAYFFELSYVSIGIFFEAFMLAYLLSKRFEWEEQEKEAAKANALQLLFEKTQENERIVREQNVVLEQKVSERTAELITEKRKSDDLLLNILPEDVAEELKATGTAKAKSYDAVSVLFTDIKDFTRISQNQTPQQLVADIDYCFRAFDAIIKRNNLEKIKTIGDAYMCAGGLPVKNETHASDIVNAALEICAFMRNLKEEKLKRNETYFEIRLGISSGSVVAGIVGSSKFAYDIWGDTVNTASRMEESSEAGKINISHSTYELVKDKFACTYRGEIAVKGKGQLKMYYVS